MAYKYKCKIYREISKCNKTQNVLLSTTLNILLL